jgi:hypothetical protein
MHLDEGESKTSMEARQEKKEREKKMMEELQEKKRRSFWLGSISRTVVLWVSIVLEWCMIVILFGQNRSNIKTMTNSWLHGELCKTGTVDSWWLCAGIVVLLLQMVGEVEENFQLRQIVSHCGAHAIRLFPVLGHHGVHPHAQSAHTPCPFCYRQFLSCDFGKQP